MPRYCSNLTSSSSGRKKIPITCKCKSQRLYWQNIGWILLVLLHGCRSAQLNHVCCIAWRRRMVGHCYEVCQQHIWFGWTLWRLLRTHSSHHHCCILHAFATFYILRSNPPLLSLDESPQCLPTLPRVSKFSLVLISSLCCCEVIAGDTFIHVSPKMSPLLFHLGWIKMFISDADSIQRCSL